MNHKKPAEDIVDIMVEKKLCLSKAEARRLLACLGEDRIKEKLGKIKVVRRGIKEDQF
jgi:hypothetical protein